MIVFLQSQGSRVEKAVTKPFYVPDGDEDTWFEIATKKLPLNWAQPSERTTGSSPLSVQLCR